MEKVIVIVGPTAVGKTKMGVEIAKKINGEVISGDSMQIYRDMNIGTAKVTASEMEGIKHHCIDIKDPQESYSVKDFQDVVREKITDITKRGKVPIIVGGTGLYIKAALYDYQFQESPIDHQDYVKKYQDYSHQDLYDYLMKIDPESASELHPNNRQRVLRAIAIYESTGMKKSDSLKMQKHEPVYDVCFIGLTLDREVLYSRIDQRVDMMISEGLEKEVFQMIQTRHYSRDLQSMKAIGYKEWFDYFEGTQTLQETVDLIKKHSRQYAKRQYTWFKNQMPVEWFDVSLDHFDWTIENVLKKVMEFDPTPKV